MTALLQVGNQMAGIVRRFCETQNEPFALKKSSIASSLYHSEAHFYPQQRGLQSPVDDVGVRRE